MTVLAMTKLKNALKKVDPVLEPHLRNVRVNRELRGCSGFVVDPRTGALAYVSTETHRSGEALYRTAEHLKDYTGGRNRYASFDDLPRAVADLLKETP